MGWDGAGLRCWGTLASKIAAEADGRAPAQQQVCSEGKGGLSTTGRPGGRRAAPGRRWAVGSKDDGLRCSGAEFRSSPCAARPLSTLLSSLQRPVSRGDEAGLGFCDRQGYNGFPGLQGREQQGSRGKAPSRAWGLSPCLLLSSCRWRPSGAPRRSSPDASTCSPGSPLSNPPLNSSWQCVVLRALQMDSTHLGWR